MRWSIAKFVVAAFCASCTNSTTTLLPCGEGSHAENGTCVPDVMLTCAAGTHQEGATCVPNVTLTCAAGTHQEGTTCVPDPTVICGAGTHAEDGACVPDVTLSCAAGTHQEGDSCVPDSTLTCGDGTHLENGACVPDVILTCASGTHLDGNTCVPDYTQPSLTTLEVAPASLTLAQGTSAQVVATGIYSDGTKRDLSDSVVWASSDETVATVSGSPVQVKAVAPGAASVTASADGKTGSATVSVTAATLVLLEVSAPSSSFAHGTTQQLTAMGTFTDGTKQTLTSSVAWGTSDGVVVSVSNVQGRQGLARAEHPGEATVLAAFGGLSATTRLTVVLAELESIEVSPASPSLAKGTQQRFTATGRYTDQSQQDLTDSVTWASSDEAVAMLANAAGTNGHFAAAGIGTAEISATLGTVVGKATLTVTPAELVSLAVSPSDAILPKGRSVRFTAEGSYTDGTTQDLTSTVVWGSSVPEYATISNGPGEEGAAAAVGEGTTTVSATSGSVSGTATLTVTAAALVSLEVLPPQASLAKGTKQQFTVNGTYTDGSILDLTSTAVWESSDEAVATLSNAERSGEATAVGLGTASVTARMEGLQSTASLEVTPEQLVSIAVTPNNPVIAAGLKLQLTATGTYTDASTRDLTSLATWSTGFSGVTVSSSGEVTAVGAGTGSVQAALGEITGSTQVMVTTAALVSIEVTPTEESVAKGRTRHFTAMGRFTDSTTHEVTTTVVWASSNPSIGRITGPGDAFAAGLGTATITASKSGLSATAAFTVTAPEVTSYAASPTTARLSSGQTVQMRMNAYLSDGTTRDVTSAVTWSTSALAIATISNTAGSKGLVTAMAEGQATVTAMTADSQVLSGAAITVLRGLGTACTSASQCLSSACADGVCCNSFCSGGCMACNLVGKSGTCSPHPVTTDPENVCGINTCNGSGSCGRRCYSPMTNPAGQWPICKPGVSVCEWVGQWGSDYCLPVCQNWRDGPAGGTTSPENIPAGQDPRNACGSYICDGQGHCHSSCTDNSACKSGYYCADPNPTNPSAPRQCMPVCKRWNASGDFVNVPASTDPYNNCGEFYCDGNGQCLTTCGNEGNNCSSACKGWCWSGVCQARMDPGAACLGGCQCKSGTCGDFWHWWQCL
ncbi:MAG: Ig-like domain-containing protein [Deltaproteobacteria bacterium]|nr:Ig-like domain-containing protein [Deltaproteobacteria bacterium]